MLLVESNPNVELFSTLPAQFVLVLVVQTRLVTIPLVYGHWKVSKIFMREDASLKHDRD